MTRFQASYPKAYRRSRHWDGSPILNPSPAGSMAYLMAGALSPDQGFLGDHDQLVGLESGMDIEMESLAGSMESQETAVATIDHHDVLRRHRFSSVQQPATQFHRSDAPVYHPDPLRSNPVDPNRSPAFIRCASIVKANVNQAAREEDSIISNPFIARPPPVHSQGSLGARKASQELARYHLWECTAQVTTKGLLEQLTLQFSHFTCSFLAASPFPHIYEDSS